MKKIALLLCPLMLLLFAFSCSSGDDDDNDDNDDAVDDDTADDDAADDDATDDDDDDNDDAADDDGSADDDAADDDAADDDAADDDDDDNDDNDNDDNDDDTTPAATAQWTFVVYMAADNNLATYGTMDLNEMKAVGSTDDVNILVVFDGRRWGDSAYYRVLHGSLETLESPGELNMGDPQTIKDGVGYLFNRYPAEHYGLVFWDHGSGWHKDAKPVYKNICVDDHSWSDDLTNTELDEALTWLQNNTPAATIDLIGFDACLMQMVEISYYIKNHSTVMVGSEETEGSEGWAYNNFLDDLVADPEMTTGSLGTEIAETFVDIPDATMSAIDLTKVEALAQAISLFADQLIAVGGMSNASVTNAWRSTLAFYDADYIDIYNFAENVKSQSINDNVNAAADAVKTAVETAVIWHGHGTRQYANEHGISIYYPGGYSSFDTGYYDLAFAQATNWDELIDD